MAINPLQLPGRMAVPQVDWSGLNQIGDAFAARNARASDEAAFGAGVDALAGPGAPPPQIGAPDTTGAVPAGGGAMPRGLRNNNPGNIKDGSFAKMQPGYAGADEGGFAKFADVNSGYGAMESLLGVYGKKGLKTTRDVISRWAPTSDNNNVPAYASFAAGGNPDAPIDWNDKAGVGALAERMAEFENGRKVPRGGTQNITQNIPAPAAGSETTASTGATPAGIPGMRTMPPGVAERIKALYAGGPGAKQAALLLLQKYSTPDEGFTLNEGATRFDSSGRVIAQGNPKGGDTNDIKDFEYAVRTGGFKGTLEDWMRVKRAGAGELGLQPIWGTDAQGNPAVMQLGKNGQGVQSKLPEGFQPLKNGERLDLGTEWGILDPTTRQIVARVPKDVQGAAAAKTAGAAQGTAQAGLPNAISQGNAFLQEIEDLRKHPGRDMMTGFGGSWNPGVPGTSTADFKARYDQLKGRTFLSAYNQLRGAGAITESEGPKAEAAVARLSRAQTREEFDTALNELSDVVSNGVKIAVGMASGAGLKAPVQIKDEAGYAALQNGQPYIDPNGKARVKGQK